MVGASSRESLQQGEPLLPPHLNPLSFPASSTSPSVSLLLVLSTSTSSTTAATTPADVCFDILVQRDEN